MFHRKPIHSPSERGPFGLIAWLEQTRIALPLKGVECRFDVCGDLLRVEIDQIFHQNAAQPVDCSYTFPLPADAAVYRCEMFVNDRVIAAKVEEKERARKIAQEKKATGHRTALVETERDNLFTLSLGNLQSEDVVVIRLAYFQLVSRLVDWTSFRIPFCPGIRYIPGRPLLRSLSGKGVSDDTDQVPDASRISPPRIDDLHPDAAYLSLQGTVEHPLGDLQDLSSPSHPVLVKPGETSSTVTLAMRNTVPDQDFVARWTEVPSAQVSSTAWVTRQRDERFALLRLKAPKDVITEDDEGQDFYFLLDRSGSMSGLKWQQTIKAFLQFLRTLGAKDRVWATLFESNFRDLAEKPFPAGELLRDRVVLRLEELGTGGGTELLPALKHVLDRVARHSAERAASLILITDGQVGNEQEILKRVGNEKRLCVHTLGIDTTVNDGFLTKLASQNRGSSRLLHPNDDIVGAVSRLGGRLRPPVLTGLQAENGWEPAGDVLPDLHAGESMCVALRGDASAGQLSVKGHLPGGAIQPLSLEITEKHEPAVPLLWASGRIDHLLSAGRQEEAIVLAKTVNLVCEGAAFLAWDPAEKVAVATQEVVQPQLAPMTIRSRLYLSQKMSLRSQSDLPPELSPFVAPGYGDEDLEDLEPSLTEIVDRLKLILPTFGLDPAYVTSKLPKILEDWAGAAATTEETAHRLAKIFSLMKRLEQIQHEFMRTRDSAESAVALTKAGLQETLDHLSAKPPGPGLWPAEKVAEMDARLRSTLRDLEIRRQLLAESFADCRKFKEQAEREIVMVVANHQLPLFEAVGSVKS